MDNSKIIVLAGSIILFLFGVYVLYNGYKYMKEHSEEKTLKKYVEISIGAILCLISIIFIILTFTNVLGNLVYNTNEKIVCRQYIDQLRTIEDAKIARPNLSSIRERYPPGKSFAIHGPDGLCINDDGEQYTIKECDNKDTKQLFTVDEFSQIKNVDSNNCIGEDTNHPSLVKPNTCQKEQTQIKKSQIYETYNDMTIRNMNGECFFKHPGPNIKLRKENCNIMNGNCSTKFSIVDSRYKLPY